MSRKMVGVWLIGAAMTVVTPGEDVKAEVMGASDAPIMESRDGCWRGEPVVSDMLTDPIVHLIMGSDGVTDRSVSALMDDVRDRLLVRAARAKDTLAVE